MAKKTFGSAVDAVEQNSLQQAADELYGVDTSSGMKAKGSERIRQIPISSITPDATQPRRVIPTSLREYAANPELLFAKWEEAADLERGYGIKLNQLLEMVNEAEDEDDQPVRGVIEMALWALVELAASIQREGLTNPITVVQNDDRYTIETGERRWMAFHLLHTITGDDRWGAIPARIMPSLSRWRQATENGIRADLNAIGKARQYAVLVMDLLGWEQFRRLDAFDHEQDFYAQAADLRVPHGKTEQILSVMGYKHRNALTRSRALLRLPRDWWERGDDEGLPEDTLLKSLQSENVPTRNNSKASYFEKLADNAEKMVQQTSRALKKARTSEQREQLRKLVHRQLQIWTALSENLPD